LRYEFNRDYEDSPVKESQEIEFLSEFEPPERLNIMVQDTNKESDVWALGVVVFKLIVSLQS